MKSPLDTTLPVTCCRLPSPFLCGSSVPRPGCVSYLRLACRDACIYTCAIFRPVTDPASDSGEPLPTGACCQGLLLAVMRGPEQLRRRKPADQTKSCSSLTVSQWD